MKCKKCENIQKDQITGMLVCLTCGNVFEDSQIVQTLEFDTNQNAAGTFLDLDKPTYYNPVRNDLSRMIDPTQIRLNKVYKYIIQIAKILTIPDSVVERAKKFYNIAANKKFTKGRKTKQIVGAVLYLACRRDGTKHLLIDFSEVLQINLFVIGSAYLKLVKLLDLEIKIIDPSLFMHRFCEKLFYGNKTKNLGLQNFEKKAKDIEKTALKILQFLKRDWITTGRRPSGLCGACLFISCKLHGYKLIIDDIANVVHVCNETIKKRIEEFSLTKLASMSKEEFEKFEDSHFYPGANPPAFNKNKEKDNDNLDNNNNLNININENNNNENFFDSNNYINTSSNKIPSFLIPAKPLKNIENNNNIKENDKLSMISEKDVNKYIYSDNEYIIRKHMWNIMFRDWLEEQREKQEKNKLQPMPSKKPRIKKISGNPNQNPYEAIKNSTKFGTKINYPYVQKIFQKK